MSSTGKMLGLCCLLFGKSIISTNLIISKEFSCVDFLTKLGHVGRGQKSPGKKKTANHFEGLHVSNSIRLPYFSFLEALDRSQTTFTSVG